MAGLQRPSAGMLPLACMSLYHPTSAATVRWPLCSRSDTNHTGAQRASTVIDMAGLPWCPCHCACHTGGNTVLSRGLVPPHHKDCQAGTQRVCCTTPYRTTSCQARATTVLLSCPVLASHLAAFQHQVMHLWVCLALVLDQLGLAQCPYQGWGMGLQGQAPESWCHLGWGMAQHYCQCLHCCWMAQLGSLEQLMWYLPAWERSDCRQYCCQQHLGWGWEMAQLLCPEWLEWYPLG